MCIPNPPCCAGRAKRSHSRSFSGDRPAIAGIRFVLSTSRLRYVHLLSSLVPGAREKRKSACYALFAHAFNLPKMWGLRAIFNSFMSCDFRLRTWCSQDNVWRVMKFSMSFSNLRPHVWFSKLSTLSLHFAHMRLGMPSSTRINQSAYPWCWSFLAIFFVPNNATLTAENPQRLHIYAIFANWATSGCLLLKRRHGIRP